MTGRRPSFAVAFPRGRELDALVEAFERGDYAHVRGEARKLALAATDEDVRRAARTLLDRTRPDRLAVALLTITVVFVGLLAAWWIVHGHPPAGPTAPVEFVR
ncbi:MAG: hypothetical protein ACLP1X_18720 [Polyangiaceae bacterium]|jgi:hypothetical protein